MIPALTQLDTRAIASSPGSHSAFMVVRNEAQRLPYCLEYHRVLGIDRFFIVDNGSDDGTREFLLDQPDCHVFHASGSFAEANYGMAWINALVALHGVGSWCLFVDVDELFTYPHSEKVTLPASSCRFLDRRNSEGVFSLLLDMYSACPIAEAIYQPGTLFLSTASYFDRDYEFRRKSNLMRNADALFDTEVFGGPRLRLFYPDFAAAAPWKRDVWRAMRKLRRHPLAKSLGLGRLGQRHGLAPDLTKDFTDQSAAGIVVDIQSPVYATSSFQNDWRFAAFQVLRCLSLSCQNGSCARTALGRGCRICPVRCADRQGAKGQPFL